MKNQFLKFMIIFTFISCNKRNDKYTNQLEFQKKELASSASWPSIISTKNGSILIFYQKATNIGLPNQVKVSIEMIKSFDGGNSWQQPINVFDLPSEATSKGYIVSQIRNLAVGTLTNNRVVLAFTVQEYPIDFNGNRIIDTITNASFKIKGLYTMFSDNEGVSFSIPRKLETNKIIAPTPHFRIITDKNNSAFMSVYGGTNSTWTNSAVEIYKSIDNGQSFNFFSTLESVYKPPFGETSLLSVDSVFHAYVRTDSNVVVQYISRNYCESWDLRGVVTNKWQIPAQPIFTKSKKVFLFSGKRDFPYQIIARVSNDFGNTYSEPKKIIDLSSPNSGYPNAVETSSGILLTYYVMPSTSNYKDDWLQSKVYLTFFHETNF